VEAKKRDSNSRQMARLGQGKGGKAEWLRTACNTLEGQESFKWEVTHNARNAQGPHLKICKCQI